MEMEIVGLNTDTKTWLAYFSGLVNFEITQRFRGGIGGQVGKPAGGFALRIPHFIWVRGAALASAMKF